MEDVEDENCMFDKEDRLNEMNFSRKCERHAEGLVNNLNIGSDWKWTRQRWIDGWTASMHVSNDTERDREGARQRTQEKKKWEKYSRIIELRKRTHDQGSLSLSLTFSAHTSCVTTQLTFDVYTKRFWATRGRENGRASRLTNVSEFSPSLSLLESESRSNQFHTRCIIITRDE